MEYKFSKLTDVEIIDSAAGTKVLVNDDGKIKQVPAEDIGGSSIPTITVTIDDVIIDESTKTKVVIKADQYKRLIQDQSVLQIYIDASAVLGMSGVFQRVGDHAFSCTSPTWYSEKVFNARFVGVLGHEVDDPSLDYTYTLTATLNDVLGDIEDLTTEAETLVDAINEVNANAPLLVHIDLRQDPIQPDVDKATLDAYCVAKKAVYLIANISDQTTNYPLPLINYQIFADESLYGFVVNVLGGQMTFGLQYTTATDTWELIEGDGWELETVDNKVTSISSASTDTQYPSAKAVYDAIQSGGNKYVHNITIRFGTDTRYALVSFCIISSDNNDYASSYNALWSVLNSRGFNDKFNPEKGVSCSGWVNYDGTIYNCNTICTDSDNIYVTYRKSADFQWELLSVSKNTSIGGNTHSDTRYAI